MRISAINNNYRVLNSKKQTKAPSFGAVFSPTKGVSTTVLGEKEDMLDLLTTAKGFNIWVFKQTKGGFANPSTNYKVMLQDAQRGTGVIKEINSSDDEESLERLKKRLEKCVIWADAPSNLHAKHVLEESKIMQKQPEYAEKIATKLLKTGISNEADGWRGKIDTL